MEGEEKREREREREGKREIRGGEERVHDQQLIVTHDSLLHTGRVSLPQQVGDIRVETTATLQLKPS